MRYTFSFRHYPACCVSAASQEVSEPADYFAKKVWHTVLEQMRLKCHKTGGDAEDSKLSSRICQGSFWLNQTRWNTIEPCSTRFRNGKKMTIGLLLKVIDEIPTTEERSSIETHTNSPSYEVMSGVLMGNRT